MRTIDKDYVVDRKIAYRIDNDTYYKYCSCPCGDSDIAELVYRTSHDEIGALHFGGDASYMAHLIAGTTKVPSHYQENKILDTDSSWLWIYDDDGKTLDLWNAKGFEVYRAGEMGLLIRFK